VTKLDRARNRVQTAATTKVRFNLDVFNFF
jgi:hypothetical protein